MVAGIGVTAYRDFDQFSSEESQAQAALGIHSHATDLLTALREAESSQLDYVRAGRASDEERYAAAADRVSKDLAEINAAARRPLAKKQAAANLTSLVFERLAQLKAGVDARRLHRVPAPVRASIGSLGDRIAALSAEIGSAPTERPEDSLARLSLYARESWLATLVGCSMLLLLVGGALYALHLAFHQHELLSQRLTRSAAEAGAFGDQWQNTLRAIGDAVLVTDAEGRITLSNQAAHTLTGWSRDGAFRVHFREVVRVVDADSHEPVDHPLAQVLESGQPAGPAARVVLMRRDGFLTPIDYSGAPIHDEAGQLLGAVLTFRDVSARRNLEAAAEARVQCYQGMLDSIGDGFIALDETFRFVYANDKAAALLGIGPGDLRGRVLWGEMPGLSNAPLGKRLIRAMRDRLPLELEEDYRGTRLAIRAYPGSVGLTIYLADVTVHRALLGDSSRGDERMQRSLRAAGAVTWEYDIAARRMEWSETAQDLFGAGQECPAALLEQMVRGPGSEFRVVMGGKERWLSWVGQALRTADGERRVAGILLDVTNQMQMRVAANGVKA